MSTDFWASTSTCSLGGLTASFHRDRSGSESWAAIDAKVVNSCKSKSLQAWVWQEETIPEVSRRHPDWSNPSQYLVKPRDPKTQLFPLGSEGIFLCLILSQTKGAGARCEFNRVNCSVFAELSTRIGHTLLRASPVDLAFPPECRLSEYGKLRAQIRVHDSVLSGSGSFRAVENRYLPLTPLACAHPVPRRVCLRLGLYFGN